LDRLCETPRVISAAVARARGRPPKGVLLLLLLREQFFANSRDDVARTKQVASQLRCMTAKLREACFARFCRLAVGAARPGGESEGDAHAHAASPAPRPSAKAAAAAAGGGVGGNGDGGAPVAGAAPPPKRAGGGARAARLDRWRAPRGGGYAPPPPAGGRGAERSRVCHSRRRVVSFRSVSSVSRFDGDDDSQAAC